MKRCVDEDCREPNWEGREECWKCGHPFPGPEG